MTRTKLFGINFFGSVTVICSMVVILMLTKINYCYYKFYCNNNLYEDNSKIIKKYNIFKLLFDNFVGFIDNFPNEKAFESSVEVFGTFFEG